MRNIKKTYKSFIALLFIFNCHAAMAIGTPVFDSANWLQAMTTATNSATQITNQLQQIQYQIQALQSLDKGTFGGSSGSLQNQISQLNEVIDSVQSIHYNINDIDREYKTLFPSESAWTNTSMDEYGTYLNKWSDQLQDASNAAMKSQSIINNVQYNNTQMQAILAQSQTAPGEVSQLQSTNQMLGIVSSQLSDLNSAVATASRVSASAVSEAQSEQDAKRAQMQELNEAPPINVNEGEHYYAN